MGIDASVDIPITGLSMAADMSIRDALLHAQRGCPELQPQLPSDDINAIVMGIQTHADKYLMGADPHSITADEAGAIYAYTVETPFYHVLNSHLRGTDR
jgi:hypothetical protein